MEHLGSQHSVKLSYFSHFKIFGRPIHNLCISIITMRELIRGDIKIHTSPVTFLSLFTISLVLGIPASISMLKNTDKCYSMFSFYKIAILKSYLRLLSRLSLLLCTPVVAPLATAGYSGLSSLSLGQPSTSLFLLLSWWFVCKTGLVLFHTSLSNGLLCLCSA